MLVPGLVSAGLITLAYLAVEQRRADKEQAVRTLAIEVLEADGVAVAPLLESPEDGRLAALLSRLFEVQKEDGLNALFVVDPEGRVLAHSQPSLTNTVVGDAFSLRAAKGDRRHWRRHENELSIAVPVEYQGNLAVVIGRYAVGQIATELTQTRLQWALWVFALWLLVGAALLAGVDAWVLRPIALLQQAMHRMSIGDLDHRVPPLPGREMGQLSTMVNRMASVIGAEQENLELAVKTRTQELTEANQRLEQLALTDGLTGIANHRRFQERLAQEILRAHRSLKPLSVLMVDVDHFKKVNDQLGHPVGDELLRQLSAVLELGLRQTDLLARYGGEEFAAILPETSNDLALQVAERMRASVETELNAGAQWPQQISVSIGVATWPHNGSTKEALMTAADAALYRAKEQGRNRVASA